MCKLRQRGRSYGGPAGSRGIDPSLQPPPAVAASPLRENWQSLPKARHPPPHWCPKEGNADARAGMAPPTWLSRRTLRGSGALTEPTAPVVHLKSWCPTLPLVSGYYVDSDPTLIAWAYI